MGNAGSVHNLHNDCINSELNSYCTQQYLRRTTGETKKKYNPVLLGGWSSGRNVADCKVLPKPTENLKLRATTNGAILQAGGTISFRAKEQLDLETKTSNAVSERTNEPAILYPMRRCHTLILDGQNESTSHRKSTTSLAKFRRSQTLLHVGYSSAKTQTNMLTNVDGSSQPSPPNTSTTSTLKGNRYNKKRKAPPAPTKLLLGLDNTTSGQNLSVDTKSTSLTKSRLYTTNNNKTTTTPQKQQQQAHKPQLQSTKNAPFQRNSNTRTSVNSSRQIQQSNSSWSSKLPYRREKSFDTILLRQRDANRDCSDTKAPTQKQRELSTPSSVNKLEEKVHDGRRKKKFIIQHDNVAVNKNTTTFTNAYHSETNYHRDMHKVDDRFRQEEPTPSDLNKDLTTKNSIKDSEPEYQSMANERKVKYQQSRIPQLKRTFYFGMESSNKPPTMIIPQTKKVQCKGEGQTEESENIQALNHNIEAEEEIVDNGILVHVRPTLPRRQPETPSFSPAAAWRNLLEEQLRLQQERSKPKQNISNSRPIEAPICFITDSQENKPSIGANWTPQQDLEDDDEDDDDNEGQDEEEQKYTTAKLSGKLEKGPENRSKSLHIFSLSLPRDVHLQCQMKSSGDCTEQENSFKAANCWLVPGFNSLQKFKTHLGKNIDFRSSRKCTCATNATIKSNSYHLQNICGDSFEVDSKSNHQPDCELNKVLLPRPPRYQYDNWLLHKSKSNDATLVASTKAAGDRCLESSLNSHSFINLQPKSLTNICGGKHIVYLPGQDAYNDPIKNNLHNPKQTKKTATKSTYKRQRQRESLQDLTPIENINQSNISAPEKNTHRFSFQSTVRVLEKRRLAEKLSKDAEIQEAQRLNELEAMKRVEEDFQRKRAPEKANLRNQLRLHLKANTENEDYRSLPLNINERHNGHHPENQHISDINNNLFCRAEPDGAASPSLDFNDNLHKTIHSNFPHTPAKSLKELKRFEFDLEESDSETQAANLQRTALLIEPYLHSII